MVYTISELAKIAAISTRTLRHYDTLGLLEPSSRNAGGHRLYQNKQLLALQQILLYRQLGFSLDEIQEIIQSEHFDVIHSLKKQKYSLKQERSRMNDIIQTIDDTIDHLIDDIPMDDFKLFLSLESEKQLKARDYLYETMGSASLAILEQQQEAADCMSKSDFKQYQTDTDTLCDAFLHLIENETPADDPTTQQWAQWYFERRLKELHNQLTSNELIQLLQAEINHPKARLQYDAVHPQFAEYFLTAMNVFLKKKPDSPPS